MTQAEKWEVERLYFREGLSTKEIASEIGLYETDVIYYINKMIKDNPRRGEIRAAAERAYPYKDGMKGYICEGSIPIFIQGAEWADSTAWKPADGDNLPEIDREVIALVEENGYYKVVFAHRPPEYWDGRNVLTNEVTRNYTKRYDKGEWNQPNIKWWLDLELPKMEE